MSKIQNLTQNNMPTNNDLEILKTHFSHCFDKNGNFDFDKFKNEISKNEIDFSKESYGMDWLGKSYARLLASDSARTLLKEDEEWNRKEENKNSENVLIKWDNLEVLKHLSHAYYEQVKMIYIDPPYNTGSDGFVYQDDRKFEVKEFSKLAWLEEEKAKRILDFVDSKSNSHSAWLTFMYPRLYIAKQLLKDDWVIFISIDENEVYQLKILMDEIFGEENFQCKLIWENKEWWGGSDSANFRIKHEYILCYAKKWSCLNINWTEITNENRYSESDEFVNSRWKYYLQKLGMWSIQYSESLDYEIYSPDNTIILPKDNNSGKKACWRWSKEKLDWWFINKFIIIKKDSKGIWTVYTKQYLNCDNEGKIIKRTNRPMWVISNYSSTQASKYLDWLFGVKIFEYSKPFQLIKYLLYISTNKWDLILDFFWGSGTTWDAVMQLNSEDGGNRKYILVQLGEEIDKEKDKIAYDFVKNKIWIEKPTIFDITKERLIRAAKNIYENNIDKNATTVKEKCECCEKETSIKIPEQKAKDLSDIDFWFKVFETTLIWEDYNFLAEEFSEKLKLFDETQLKEEDIQTLLTTWKTADNIALTKEFKKIDLWWYTSYYFADKLYLMNKDFETKNLKVLLEKIDSDKTFEPKTIIAFWYHFESKNLREIAENIKAYSNKKCLDIDFITRY